MECNNMATEPVTKKKVAHHKAPPAPPALGIAERSGDGWKFTIVLGGLKVNKKKFEPQAGAELLAGMLEDGMKRLSPARRSGTSPEKALADLEAADSAATGDARAPAAPAMGPGQV
jgi:hypothetical protein